MQSRAQDESTEDAGFALIGAIVLVFLVLLTLSVAAPRMAMEIKRDRELESKHRAQQYVRAIRVYYLKFGHYPGSVEQLEKSNNQRFLRAKYIDPLTGKDDWRIIHVGENKTKVKGFFGEELQGLAGGLGSAAGLASGNGGQTTGGSNTGGSSFNNSGIGGNGGGSNLNSGGTTATGSGTGSSTSGSGISSQSATDATGTGGPIMGIGSSKTGEAMIVVNEASTYQDWEYLYDPRIEALYKNATLLGGISSGSGASGGFGTPIGSGTTTPGTSGTGSGFGSGSGSGSGSGTGIGTGTGSTPPQ